MADAAEKVKEAVEAVADAGDAIGDAALTTANAEAALEAAEERAEIAEETAEAIAESARHSEIMRGIEAHKSEVTTWREGIAAQLAALETMQNEMRTQMAELQKTPVVTVETKASPEAATSSIPLPSPEKPEAKTETVVTVTPGSGPSENTPRAAPAPKRRFL